MKSPLLTDEYFAYIMHDLKFPAMAQVCALKSLLNNSKVKFDSDEKDLIELTLNSCNYMKKLIDIFNSIYKLNTDKLVLNFTKFNISELIVEVTNEINILLKYNNLKLEMSLDDSIVLNADKFYIKYAIENIISNCIRNAYRNTIIKINVSLFKNQMIFEVKTNSKCFDEYVFKEIFNKSKKYAAQFRRSGIGLGMYLSKEIIHAHFGKMIIKSYNDDVNALGFYLPIYADKK